MKKLPRLNILIASREFPPLGGGAGSYARNLALGLLRDGHRVSVLTVSVRANEAEERRSDRELKGAGIESVHRVVFRPKLYLISLGLALRKQIRGGRHDVVLVADSGAQKAASLTAPPFDVPVWTVFHGSELTNYFEAKSPVFRLFGGEERMRRFLQNVTGCIVVSEFMANRLARELPKLRDKLHVVLHGIDVDCLGSANVLSPDAARRQLGLPTEAKILLTAGRLVEEKGQDSLIRMLAEWREDAQDVLLVIAGQGPYERTLRQLATRLGVENRVAFVGHVHQKLMPVYFCASDLVVQLSRIPTESFGLVHIEAHVCGRPSIGLKVGGVSEAVEHGVTGLVFDVNEINLGRLIMQCLRDEDALKSMGQAARQRAIDKFGLDSLAKHTAELFYRYSLW